MSYVGRSPIATDGTVMRMIEKTKAFLLPTRRSPISPNKTAPRGLLTICVCVCVCPYELGKIRVLMQFRLLYALNKLDYEQLTS